MRSRFLTDLTSTEVSEYLSKGGKTAILPAGSVEMHGPHLPIGTDTMIAKAFSLQLAEKANGLVLPEIQYTWAGSTDGFCGSISVEPELVMMQAEAVADKVFRMGFKRLIIISNHNTNYCPFYLFVRRYYEKYQRPVIFFNPYDKLFSSPMERERFFGGEYWKGWECSILLGALKILGIQDLYTIEELAYDDEAPPLNESYKKISSVAIVGYFMQDERQHVCPTRYISAEKGLNYIKECVERIVDILDDLDNYSEYSVNQINKGWWSRNKA